MLDASGHQGSHTIRRDGFLKLIVSVKKKLVSSPPELSGVILDFIFQACKMTLLISFDHVLSF